ncbi:MAG TPA: S8 family serine peptidase [Longimicrobium sp.]|nr:S8 family serine peptidase [Longimicrobium sp.]
MKRSLSFLPLLVLAACSDTADTVTGARPAPEAPVFSAAPGQRIDGSYIVVLKEGADPRSVAAVAGVNPRFVYGRVLNGFAGSLSQGQLNALQHNPNVERIEEDGIATASTTQSGATWGIDRTDQRDLPLSTTYSYTATASNVNSYIIDTGIRTGHGEFGGRASAGFDAFTDGQQSQDCNGHGTHVAGTVGGSTYGLAKGTKLIAVRVLDCAGSGSWSGVIAGMDWVASNHVKPAVANMSLGGGKSASINDAVARMSDAGVTVVVAAGNDGRDACQFSPASAPSAVTVGATAKTDARASYSNHGTCLDIFAPGSGITSAWYTGDTAINTISGTSMASPHVAGVAALYLAGNPGASPSTVTNALTASATLNKVTDARRGSPNRLLFSNY